MIMKNYYVKICFDKNMIYGIDVKAKDKKEAYQKAKYFLAKKLFKNSKLTNYECTEL